MASYIYFDKTWDDLDFSDSNILAAVLREEKICKEFVKIILNIDIEEIEIDDNKKTASDWLDDVIYGYRAVVTEKETKRKILLLINGGEANNLLLKARFFQHKLDKDSGIRNGQTDEYDGSYIVFINRFDKIGMGCPVYTRKIFFEECPDYNYDDRSNMIIFNASAYEKVNDPRLKALLKYFCFSIPCDEFTKRINNFVSCIKIDKKLEANYCSIYYECEEARFEMSRNYNLSCAKKMIIDNTMSYEQIAEILKLSLSDVENLAEKIKKGEVDDDEEDDD